MKTIDQLPAEAAGNCPAAGHVHPGDPAQVRGVNRTQRGFWGNAPGPCGYYTAWVEWAGEIFLTPKGVEHGHKLA